MKKILSLCVLNVALMTGANASAAELGLGYAKGSNVDNVTFFGGLNVFSNIGARLEYTKNIIDGASFSKKNITRYGLFATYTLPLTANISVTPKAGLVKTKGSFDVTDVLKTISASSTDFSYGLELNYDYNSNIAVFVGYTDYTGKLNMANVKKSDLDRSNVTFGIKIAL